MEEHGRHYCTVEWQETSLHHITSPCTNVARNRAWRIPPLRRDLVEPDDDPPAERGKMSSTGDSCPVLVVVVLS